MKPASIPRRKKTKITDGMTDEVHISYQVTIVANLMAFGSRVQNVERFGVNFREWRLLSAIGRMGPQTARQIVDIIHQDKATISRAVKDLSDRALIVKLPNKKHKRSPLIWFSEQGKALYDKILPVATNQAEDLTQVLTRDEKRRLCELLDKLKDHIEEIDEIDQT